MSTAIVGPGTPYVTPDMLKAAPTGISWATVPKRDATPAAQRAEMLNMCMRATEMVDSACNQVVRATVDTEQLRGPDFRVTIPKGSGTARLLMSRWPVLQVLGGQIAPSAQFPRSWSFIPANQFDIDTPIVGVFGTNTPSGAGEGGQAVILAPGWVNWLYGRNGWVVRTTYVNGWPHAGLTAGATAGSTTLVVDDCTGWAPIEDGGQGATGVIQDGGSQEAVTVLTTSSAAGPGVMTLSAPLLYDHPAGIVVTTIPDKLVWATILFCCAQALTRGATSTSVQSATPSPTGGTSPDSYTKAATAMCVPYGRVM